MTFTGTYSIILNVLVRVTSYKVQCASGSAVEHLLAKEGVAGSIPVSRSHEKKNDTKSVSFFFSSPARARKFDVYAPLRSAWKISEAKGNTYLFRFV